MDAGDLQDGFRLGDWVVEPQAGRIATREESRSLAPHLIRILLLLAERHGLGQIGADFWPVPGPDGRSASTLVGRFPSTSEGNLGIYAGQLLYPGPDGPVPAATELKDLMDGKPARRIRPKTEWFERQEPALAGKASYLSTDWVIIRTVIYFGVWSTIALVWSGALSFENAVKVALDAGAQWDASILRTAAAELDRKGRAKSEVNLGWLCFDRVRQVLEGRSVLALGATLSSPPAVEAPSRPFWYPVTAADDPVRLETLRDVQWSLESLNFASWSPRFPSGSASAGRDRGCCGSIAGWRRSWWRLRRRRC